MSKSKYENGYLQYIEYNLQTLRRATRQEIHMNYLKLNKLLFTLTYYF